jgi:salicylate hydroxylase
MRIIVIGAGIAGLTTAIALRKAGIDTQVYEKAPTLTEVGAGIAIAANAQRALEVLALASDLHSQSSSGV